MRLIKPTTAQCVHCGKLFDFDKPIDWSVPCFCSLECVRKSRKTKQKVNTP